MKQYLFYLLLSILLFSCTDTIDNLNQIAGFEDFGLAIIKPEPDSVIMGGQDYTIKWRLEASKARLLKIELLRDNEIIYLITKETKHLMMVNISGRILLTLQAIDIFLDL